MKKSILSAKDVCKSFEKGEGASLILDHISLDIYEGDFTVIMGSSGAGKSTLLYALSGLNELTSGGVTYKEKLLSQYKEKEMAKLRANDFGFVFQQSNLVSHLSLYENVVVAGYQGAHTERKEVPERTKVLLKQMHLEEAMHRLPAHVSGGEKQRGALARAVINRPQIVFADEPTGALNRRHTEDVLDILTTLNRSGQSIVMVTHDVRAALRGNRILYMEDGKLVGEKLMAPFEGATLKERESNLNAWLFSMKW